MSLVAKESILDEKSKTNIESHLFCPIPYVQVQVPYLVPVPHYCYCTSTITSVGQLRAPTDRIEAKF